MRIFEIALSKADCKAEEAVMVGDRLDNDIVPANKIGMKTVWIKQGFGGLAVPMAQDEQPNFTISNLSELCAFGSHFDCILKSQPFCLVKIIITNICICLWSFQIFSESNTLGQGGLWREFSLYLFRAYIFLRCISHREFLGWLCRYGLGCYGFCMIGIEGYVDLL